MRCTCGPHPRVDLHLAGGGGDAAALSACRRRVRAACASHGCFHATLRLADASSRPLSGDEAALACLARPTTQIGEDVESLFAPEFFLEKVVNRCSDKKEGTSDGHECNEWEDICNGGLREVPFPTNSLPDRTNQTDRPAVTATFRGRMAESGDETQPAPEPKLSWEFRRCLGAGNDLQMATGEDPSLAENAGDVWSLLPQWTNALHSVASTIIHLLGIPPQLALQERRCRCLGENSNNSSSGCRKCNIDLLRVFRYDALPPSADGDATMGSSAHSDWGTLTVVWQDDKGGLQTYCHACDKWSDVDASSEASGASNGCESNAINLFVHVGDFLSLASMGEGGDGMPAWPSPRHRVLCPAAGAGSTPDAESCRRSLVYFAYPPPGVSLDEAQRVVAPLASPSSASPDAERSSDSAAVYDCYSLLHDQSQQPAAKGKEYGLGNAKESASLRTHERIRGVAFDEVIAEKWGQVQRRSPI